MTTHEKSRQLVGKTGDSEIQSIANPVGQSRQGKLGFVHQTAETSSAAFRSVASKSSDRKTAIENHLLMAGCDGLTRHELASRMGILLSSVCGLVRQLVLDGTAVESGDTRSSPSGRSSKVVRLPQFTGGQHG